MSAITRERLESAFRVAVGRLLQEMNPAGFWEGELSSSALSTATAVSALSLAGVQSDEEMIWSGVSWLAQTQNTDGGWGDTIDSPSNLATTLLAVSALTLAGAEPEFGKTLRMAEDHISSQAGKTANERVAAIQRIYGADRTFAVPILVNCALAGLVPWDQIPGLPFELAVLPSAWYRAFRLHVVSYALPALIAIGLAINHHSPRGFPPSRLLRRLITGQVLSRLEQIQPEHGGFLEAVPLTSFVAMSLAPIYGADHLVVSRCLGFIRQSQQVDGSWSIDTNLSVWLTTGAISALAEAGWLDEIDTERTRKWLVERQFSATHPFTGAAPGAWGWTHLPGSVPDADDTSGAVLACLRFGERDAACAGVRWLLDLRNTDGGWPTFCRGWGRLPFDRSSPDITAHALRAILAFDPERGDADCRHAVKRGFAYLAAIQRPDGAWAPLWFGNQSTADKSNPVLGTSRVLLAYADSETCGVETGKGVQYLLNSQNQDGGWGGDRGTASSIEETALAVAALSRLEHSFDAHDAIWRGIGYLVLRIEDASWTIPTPIGLYFSSLWYSERLYPIIWTVEALGRIMNKQSGHQNRSNCYVRGKKR
ncbi:MAG: squalene--hopene cyclase [Armatimonadetes bacterium]|nr:squalene--hopene cyclase [Armatimonadota bacterium]